jgi:hypothetical protein
MQSHHFYIYKISIFLNIETFVFLLRKKHLSEEHGSILKL